MYESVPQMWYKTDVVNDDRWDVVNVDKIFGKTVVVNKYKCYVEDVYNNRTMLDYVGTKLLL